MLKLRFYRTETGKVPYLDWLSGLKDKVAAARIAQRINRVRAGNPGDWKSLESGLRELRFQFGPGYRVYYVIEDDTILILLAGGDKSSQQRDIARALEYLSDMRERDDDESDD